MAAVSSDSEDDESADTDDCFLDEDENFEERSDHNSEWEQNADEILEQDPGAKLQCDSPYYFKKYKITKWYKKKSKTSIHDCFSKIVIHSPGSKGVAKSCKTSIEFSNCLYQMI